MSDYRQQEESEQQQYEESFKKLWESIDNGAPPQVIAQLMKDARITTLEAPNE